MNQARKTKNGGLAAALLLAGMIAAAALLQGCGGNADDASETRTTLAPPPSTDQVDVGEPTPTPTTSAADTTEPPADEPAEGPSVERGWINGEPDWNGGIEMDRIAGERSAGALELVSDESVEAADDGQQLLTGGSVDDNEGFEEYLEYRRERLQNGIQARELDPSGRAVVTVLGEGRLPAAGAEVLISGPHADASLRTTADGTVRFHPEAYGAGDGPFSVSAGGVFDVVERDGNVTIVTDLPTASPDRTIDLDVLFLVDTTGSMGDEIDQMKATIRDVAEQVAALPGAINVRFGMTLYRDIDDAFLTSTFDLTNDVDEFASALSNVVASGGGDYPEALDEALDEALFYPSWREPTRTLQIIFLIADAPPQVGRQVGVPYTESMLDAAGRGIKIFPVSSSGTDDQAEFVFRQLAQFTGGRYVFLTYGAAGRATGESSDITASDYDDLSLNDLIVRTIADEIGALTTPAGDR